MDVCKQENIGQVFLNLKILCPERKIDLLKFCKMIKVKNEGVCVPG